MSRTRPAFELAVDGERVAVEASWSCRIEDKVGLESDTMQIVMDGSDRYEWPRLNAEIDVSMGYLDEGESLQPMGLYRVDGVQLNGPPWALTVTGHPGDIAAALSRSQARAWVDLTVEQIVADVAMGAGVPYRVADVLRSEVIGYEEQLDESDLDLLARLARRFNCVARIMGGKLIAAPRHESRSVSGLNMGTVTLRRTDFDTLRVSQQDRGKVGEIVAKVRVSGPTKKRAVGKSVSHSFGTGEPKRTLKKTFASYAEAEAAVVAYRQASEGMLWQMSGTLAAGDGRILAEQRLSTPDVHPDIPAEWTVTSVTHAVDSGGFTTSLDAERAVPR